jgi:hypothetical protein
LSGAIGAVSSFIGCPHPAITVRVTGEGHG